MKGRVQLREPRRSLLTGAKRPFARPEGLGESLSASTRSARSESRDRNCTRVFGVYNSEDAAAYLNTICGPLHSFSYLRTEPSDMEHEATVEGVGIGVGEEGPGAPVVLLRAREEVVPIFVSSDQAQSMQLALEGEPFERPLTHDLMVEMVAEFGAAIDRVRIDDLADGTFYAKIDTEQYLDDRRKEMVFDARPSDGIAIALRVDCPLIVSDEVVDEAGQPPEAFEEAPEEDDDSEFEL
ncbi:protein of unknown function DUF151 [Halomicrobium mukohataei DSM 12286]|uniref:BFN domain-containing protein n=2 Tax=Halomicrobium mukohataei TaxID=57705 RepID=C7NVN9_HALMD|nr:protein of unknown function DUF151 [Halomicrobium mukohataei DSM 12286]